MGSPKNLDECVTNIICFRPAKGISIQDHAKNNIRDLLAQKFGVAILRMDMWREGSTTQQPEDILKELWERITGEKL